MFMMQQILMEMNFQNNQNFKNCKKRQEAKILIIIQSIKQTKFLMNIMT